MSTLKVSPKPKNIDMQGEGNYTAAKKYDEATTNFVKAGKVGKAVQEAKPKNAQDEHEMLAAEEAGRARAKTKTSSKTLHVPEPNTGSDNAPKKGSNKAPNR